MATKEKTTFFAQCDDCGKVANQECGSKEEAVATALGYSWYQIQDGGRSILVCSACKANRLPNVTLRVGSGQTKTTNRFAMALARVIGLWRNKHKSDPRIVHTLEHFMTEVAIIVEEEYPDGIKPYEASWIFLSEIENEVQADQYKMEDTIRETREALDGPTKQDRFPV